MPLEWQNNPLLGALPGTRPTPDHSTPHRYVPLLPSLCAVKVVHEPFVLTNVKEACVSPLSLLSSPRDVPALLSQRISRALPGHAASSDERIKQARAPERPVTP